MRDSGSNLGIKHFFSYVCSRVLEKGRSSRAKIDQFVSIEKKKPKFRRHDHGRTIEQIKTYTGKITYAMRRLRIHLRITIDCPIMDSEITV